MHKKALNGKLGEMCDLVGLFRRNTIYLFCRGTIVDQRRKQGTETAKELAGHSADGSIIRIYDDSVEDEDMPTSDMDRRQHARSPCARRVRRPPPSASLSTNTM
jgi:hypothetical protein